MSAFLCAVGVHRWHVARVLSLRYGRIITKRCRWCDRERADNRMVTDDTHDCATCRPCLHDGHKCCGCYDGACCRGT